MSTKARELAELSRTIIDTSDATAITINADEEVTLADDLFLADGKKAVFGAGNDLEIFSAGSTALIKAGNATSDVRIESDNRLVIADRGFNEAFAVFNDDADVKLFHNGIQRFATASTGIDVTGLLSTTGSIRAAGDAVPTTGSGVELVFSSNIGNITSYDRSNSAYRHLNINGSSLDFKISNSNALSIDSSSNATFTGTISSGAITTNIASHGTLIDLQVGGASKGNIKTVDNDVVIHTTESGHSGLRLGNTYVAPTDNAGAVVNGTIDLGLDSYRFNAVKALSGDFTTTGTASLADGTNTLRLTREGGHAAGSLGTGITFAQRWYDQSTQNVRTGGIFGIKSNGSGGYGGGLAFYSQPNNANDMIRALLIDSSQNATFTGKVTIGASSHDDTLVVFTDASNKGITIHSGSTSSFENPTLTFIDQGNSTSTLAVKGDAFCFSTYNTTNALQVIGNGGLTKANNGLEVSGAATFNSTISSGAITATSNGNDQIHLKGTDTTATAILMDYNGTGATDRVRIYNYQGDFQFFTENGNQKLSIAKTTGNAVFAGTISGGAITANGVITATHTDGTHNISLSPTSTGGVINARNSSGTSVAVMDGRGTPFIDVTGNLKTGGTIRIDSSGNLSNIGTISSGAITALTANGSTTLPNVVLTLQANTVSAITTGGGTAIKFKGVSSGGNVQNYDQAMIASVGQATNNAHGLDFYYKPNGSTALTKGLSLSSIGEVVVHNQLVGNGGINVSAAGGSNIFYASTMDSRVLKLRDISSNNGNIVQFQLNNGTNIWELVGRDGSFYIFKNTGTGSGYKWQIDSSGNHTFTGGATFSNGVLFNNEVTLGTNASTTNAGRLRLEGAFANTGAASHPRLTFSDDNFGIGAGGWGGTSTNDDLYLWAYNGAGRKIRFCATSAGSQGVASASWVTNATIDHEGNFDLPRGDLTVSNDVLVGTTSTSGVTAGSNNGAYISGSSNSAFSRSTALNRAQIAFYNPNGLVGQIGTSGSGTYYNTSSDVRLKDNIVDAPSASADIDAIQVRSFDWKVDGSHQKYGMVAQELQTVAPEAVSAPEDPEEMMGVDYSKLVPMMVKEIQSLRARVAALESEEEAA
jgi:hypothetical protein